MMTTKQQADPGDDAVPTMLMTLKAPVELFERLDRWCEQQQRQRGMTMKPSRPAAIRYIVHNFLLKQEQRRKRSARKQTSSSSPASRR
jgi:hypothetical protein